MGVSPEVPSVQRPLGRPAGDNIGYLDGSILDRGLEHTDSGIRDLEFEGTFK